MMKVLRNISGAVLASVLLIGCAVQPKPYDYSEYRAHPPRSILVLPPINHSPDVKGTYGYLTTVTRPIAEKGYYVFPVELVDAFMKENGQTLPEDMHNIPLQKLGEVFGADAVLYTDLKQYGTTYVLLDSITTVTVYARLVDVRTGTQIWNGAATFSQNVGGGGGGNPLAALIAKAVTSLIKQIVDSSTDAAHKVAPITNTILVANEPRGLLDGPYASMRK